MKTKIRYWLPSVGLSAALLSLVAVASLIVAISISSLAHAAGPATSINDPSMPGLSLAQADGIASPAATLEPVSTSTPSSIPADTGAALSEGVQAITAFSKGDYELGVGLVLFLLLWAFHEFGPEIPQADRAIATILAAAALPAALACAAHLAWALVGKAAAGGAYAGIVAEGGVAFVVPLLKALFAKLTGKAAPKPAA